MKSHHYLKSVHTFDRAAIMRAAWAKAHHNASLSGKRIGTFTHAVVTLREAFADALRRIWGMAREERSYAVWAAEQVAARLVPVTPLAAAQMAVVIAEHADSFTAASNAALAAARAHLAALQHSA